MNPTMEKSRKIESKERAKDLALIQQYKNLRKEWKFLKKSRPRNPCSYLISSDGSSTITSFDQLWDNSPRELMSSLQHRKSPSNRVLRVRSSNMAVEEILMDRRAAITSGKLKGRRLFSAAAEECDLSYGGGGGGEICGDWLNDMIQEREVNVSNDCSGMPVVFNQSCSCSDSSLSEEKSVVVEEKKVVEVANAAEKRGGDHRMRRRGGWCVVAVASFAVVLILITLGLDSMSSTGNHAQKNGMILVPT